jgi:superfamily II DNA or RNA helicase
LLSNTDPGITLAETVNSWHERILCMAKAMKLKPKKKKLKVRAVESVKKPKAILRHRLFVPAEYVTQEMKDSYTDEIPDALPETDEYGDPVLDRTLYLEGWKRHKRSHRYSFVRGDVAKYKELFKDFDIVDKTADVMLKHDIKFLGVLVDGEYMPLYPEQKKAIKEMLQNHYGILEAPPRFGKTTVMTKLITLYKRRTVVFVHQIDLAQQFEKEFRRCTNINEIEKRTGRKLIGLARTWEEVSKYEVAIVTWQKWHAGKGGKEALKKFSNSFGLTLVDEGHRFSSKFSAKVVDRFNTRFRISVTATPERKDQRDAVIKQIIGPVTVRGKKKQVPLHVHLVYTGFAPKFSRWTTYMSKIMKSKTRNKLCLKQVEKEVGEGHSVLVVTVLVKHILDLVANLKSKGIAAEAFYGGAKDREGILQRAKAGRTKVIVGMRSMLTGVNVPRWDVIHILAPTANKPNHYQEFSRVRTIHPGKRFATVFHYLDNCGAGRGCYRTVHSNYISPLYQPISFVDKHGNVLKKNPSLKLINELSSEAGKYNDTPDTEGNGKRKPVGFAGGKPIFGWSNASMFKSTRGKR